MAAERGLICVSTELVNSGDGVRFELVGVAGAAEPAFVIRHCGEVRGYLNRCAHVPVELDWQPGRFFDFDRRFLICATHGALYEPASGRCVAGPCRGARLEVVQVIERNGGVYVADPACSVRREGPDRSVGQ